MKTKAKHETHVSQRKVKELSELKKLAKEKRTILIASIKNIPLSQYQEISKKLRANTTVKVPKKSIIFRMLDSLGDESAVQFKDKIEESTAILFSDLDSFELAAELVNKRSPAKAKAGQEAPADIEIPAGPTDLVPGPAISELGALGIQIQIDKGKINIKEPKVIVKKGDKIPSNAADVMNKLGIKPFTIGFVPLAALDTKEKKVYSNIKIDSEGTIKEIKFAFSKALPFAVAIGYTSQDTIKLLIAKAGREELVLMKFSENKVNVKTESLVNGDLEVNEVEIENAQEENSPETKSNSEGL